VTEKREERDTNKSNENAKTPFDNITSYISRKALFSSSVSEREV
jgi:hypothetical protein